jgi:hypothetical protein
MDPDMPRRLKTQSADCRFGESSAGGGARHDEGASIVKASSLGNFPNFVAGKKIRAAVSKRSLESGNRVSML